MGCFEGNMIYAPTIASTSVLYCFSRRTFLSTKSVIPWGPCSMNDVRIPHICVPTRAGLPQKVHALVEDAVAKGAKLLTGGKLPGKGSVGQFYPPTVLLGVKRGMKIWEEEVFGPVSKGGGTLDCMVIQGKWRLFMKEMGLCKCMLPGTSFQ